MITLQKMNEQSKEIKRISECYEKAFPENERKPLEPLLQDKSGCGEVFSFYDENEWIGFACMISSPKVAHIIYLVIDDTLRSKGYGSKVLQLLHETKPQHQFIVDVERVDETANNAVQRIKRNQFYKRNHYQETEVKYNWFEENYEILVSKGTFSTQDFYDFWDFVYEANEVYRNY